MTAVQSQQAKATILIIDDALENRILLTSQLKSGNYCILQAASGTEGIQIALDELPDLILLDVMMPGMNGFDVSTILKKKPTTKNIPIIIVTALREVSYRIKGIEAGADEFLSRPHNREELLVRVKSLIQLKRARERLEAERNHLQLLYNVSQATMSHTDVVEIITSIISYTQEAVGATKGVIMVTNPDGDVTHKILVRASSGTRMGDKVATQVMSDGFAGWLWRKSHGDIIHNTIEDERWVDIADDDEAGSAIGVPLVKADGETLGLIILSHPKANYFQLSHLDLLKTIGGQVAAAIYNARLFTEVNEERRKLSTILEQSNDVVITTDERHCVMLFNRAAEFIFKVKEEDIVGRCLCDIHELQPISHLFRHDIDEPLSDEIGLDTGPILSASVTKIANIGSVAVMQDITERKLAEARQIDIERQKEAERLKKARRDRDAWRKTMGRYISPSLLADFFPETGEMLDADQVFKRRKGWAVVLFADLRNSTEMIVKLSADTAIDVLHKFFTEMTEIIHENHGTIFDFIGDELEVGFNVPLHQENPAHLALKTAIEMQIAFSKLWEGSRIEYDIQLGLGIGIDQGDVIIGNVGSNERWHFAIVGEAVNNAHHLVNLAEDSEVIISAEVLEKLEQERIELEEDDTLCYTFTEERVALKGKNGESKIYRTKIPHKVTERTPEHT